MTCNWLFNMICHEQNKHFAKKGNPKQSYFFKAKMYDLKCTRWIGLVNWAIHSQQPSSQCHWHYFKWKNLNWWKANVPLVFPGWHLNKWQFHSRIEHTWYLSFFLHGQNFWRIEFTPKKRVNYDKIHNKLPIFCVIMAKYTVNCQFFALNL